MLSGLTGLCLALPARACPQNLQRGWPGGAAGAVSLTYDDGLNTQLDVAAPELERRGWRGTFYLTQDNIGDRLSDWAALARRGHEVENHTRTHPCTLGKFGSADFERREVKPVESLLANMAGDHSEPTFAYPCGYLGLGRGTRGARYGRYRRLLERDFKAARTTAGGPNDPARVRADRFELHAFEPTYDTDRLAPAARYLRETVQRGAWAILVFHEIVPEWRGEGDASVGMHARILDMIADHGLWCAPVGRVLAELKI